MDIFGAFLDGLSGLFKGLLNVVALIAQTVMLFLPDSPFQLLDNTPIQPYLGYINWFIPVSQIVSIVAAWIFCVGIYYAYSIILRWVKAVN